MILVIAVIVAVLVALIRGGCLTRLVDLRVRHAWLALVALLLQYPLVYNRVGDQTIFGVPLANLMMAVSCALVLYLIGANRRLPGIPLVGLGMLANLTVMALNSGWMPITPEALARLGGMSRLTASGPLIRVWGAKNIALPQAQTRLWWLSDIFLVVLPFLAPAAFSIGDVLVAAGLFWLLQYALLAGGRESCSPS